MQTNEILLSIVIPHYNVSPYINCLYHVLFPQINDAVEVILIDDASTDTTKEIMQQWETKNVHPNIHFYYQERNLGLSGTRNAGVQLASGEYVWFIDSDDTIDENAVEEIVRHIKETKSDAIVFDFFKFTGSDEICNKELQTALHQKHSDQLHIERSKYRSLKQYSVTTDTALLLTALFDDAQMYVCFYVIRRIFWLKTPFPLGRNYEDIAVMPKIIDHLSTLYYLPKSLYYYRQREKSIGTAPTIQSCFDINRSIKEISDYFQHYPLSESTQLALYTFYTRMLRLSYEKLYRHHLLNKETKAQYRIYEDAFLKRLPWHIYRFIPKMRVYPIFKITTFFFFTNKHLYIKIKQMGGKQ